MFHYKEINQKQYDQYLDEVLLTRNNIDMILSLIQFNVSGEDSPCAKGSGQINAVETECLILHSEQDRLIEMKEIEDTKEALKNSKIVTFKEGSHSLATDFPEEVMNVIIEFVKA